MVNEFRTSKLCSHCHQELTHQRVSKGLETKELYRVLVCQHCRNDRLESLCHFFNRDINACINMLFLAKEWFEKRERPIKYRRETVLTTQVGKLGPL